MLGPTIVLSEGLGTALEGSVKKRVCIRAPRCHNDKTTLDDITFKLCRYVCVDEWCICVTDYVGYQNGEGKTLPHAQGKVMRWRYKSLWWEAIPLSITSIGRWSALVSDISAYAWDKKWTKHCNFVVLHFWSQSKVWVTWDWISDAHAPISQSMW